MLGFYPDNINLYHQAFIHRSITPIQYGNNSNNERLEFLGDALLDAIIAEIVFKHFPYKGEGFLTNTRSKIVKRETMNYVAIELGLDKKVISKPYVTTHHKYMYGNALEALIGAIYLDKGYKCCYRFVYRRIINAFFYLDKLATQEVNFKSRLLEWGQKKRLEIEFHLIREEQDEYGKVVFQSSVSINNSIIATGYGYTKKESQQNASKKVLNKIKKDKQTQQLIRNIMENRS